ncbi:MAG: hypothetical protein HPY83_14865 [Anaerolineae bacterium]|nr:hypothetical protein [Anaerolineae bacterium]
MIISRRADMGALFSIVVMLLVGCTSATPASIASPTSTRPRESPQSPAPPARATMAPTPAAEVREVVSPVSPLPTPSASPTRRPAPTPTPTIAWPTCESFPATISFLRDNNIWLLDAQSGTERQLTYEPEGMGLGYAPSPDGKWIAYVTWSFPDWALKLVSTESGEVRLLEESRRPRIPGSLAWSDDRHLQYHVLIGTEYISGEPEEVSSVVVVDLETGAHRELATTTFHHPSPDGRYELTGHWSPGGYLLPEHVPYQLLDHKTGEQRSVMEEPADFRGWSPDSELMLFSLSLGREYTSSLVAIDAETLNRCALTPEGKRAGWPAWSPDSENVAYVQCSPEAPEVGCLDLELWIADRHGGSRQQVLSRDCAPLEGRVGTPVSEAIFLLELLSWTPDGSRLVFSVTHDTGRDLWSARADGSGLCRLAAGAWPHALDSAD